MTSQAPNLVEQLSLGLTSRHADLHPYWRARLRQWVHDALYYRHARGTTGWSMVTRGYDFARWLFRDGQLSRAELKRYFRFNLRIQRMERNHRTVAACSRPGVCPEFSALRRKHGQRRTAA